MILRKQNETVLHPALDKLGIPHRGKRRPSLIRIQPFAATEHAGSLLEPGQPVLVEKAGQSIHSGDHSIAKAVTIEFKKAFAWALGPDLRGYQELRN